ncbi:uncharacterized protein LOC134463364 [Engraulis encrasicolus]|uniref:uncharacterized protein LOC134463364 n=1 Tax=Engraulis encrasicolus TaxID=184585 RepID=UPI002FCFD45A
MDSGSPPRHVQWGSYVDEEEVEYEEEGEGEEEEEEENDGFVGESEGYEEEEEVCVEGDDEFDEEESEVLEMEEQEQEQEQEQETGKAEEAGQTSRPVGQFSFLSRKLSVWDTSKYISKWKLAHILQYHLKTFCNDETHRKFVAQQERDCKSSVPLPIVCMMEKEALSILEKTERTYRSRFGANHQLTKDVQERISALRTRLAARYGSAPPCAASAWQSFLLDWFPWLSTWLRKLQHYRYLAQKKKRERKKKWRMQVGGGENVDGAPDVPLEDEEEEEEEENDGMMDSMKGWVVDTVRRVSVYSGLIPDDEEEKDPDATAKTEERRGWRQWMGDVLKRASDAVVGQQPHGQGEHLADGTEEPRGWRQWMGGLLKRASDAVEGSKRGGEDDNKLKKPAEKPEGEGEKLQLPTQGQGEEPPHVDVQETEEGQPRPSGWNQQLRNMVSSTLPTNIGTHQAEWSQRVRNTIRRLSDGASATHEHETIPSEQLPGEEEQQQQQQQRQAGWGQRLRNMVQLPGGRASVTPEDEMIPMDQLQSDSEGQQQQQQQRQQPSRPRWEQRLAALRGQRATPQEGDMESDDQEEPGDNQVPPQPSQSQQQHHDV